MGRGRGIGCLPNPGERASHLPSGSTSDLPPEGCIDGQQCEQSHAGHRTANHQGDRGSTCQLQGLWETGCWERVKVGHPVSLSDASRHAPHVQEGTHAQMYLHSLIHMLLDTTSCTHVHARSHSPTATCSGAGVMTVSSNSPPLPMCRPRYICPGPHLGSPDALSSLGLSPTHQVLGWLSQDGKGGQVLALAAGVSRLGLQGLAALSVPVPRVGISWRRERWHEPRAQLCDPKATAGSPKMCS